MSQQIHSRTRTCVYSTITVVQEVSPAVSRGFTGRLVISEDPLPRGVRGSLSESLAPLTVIRSKRLNNVVLLVPLRSVQFSLVVTRGHTFGTCNTMVAARRQ